MKFMFVLLLLSCNSSYKSIPAAMPADFKIEYHYDGGMMNTSRTIIIQSGACSDKGTDEGTPYEYEWNNEDLPGLENLYTELKKLKAFTLKSKNEGEVYDRGGESMRFTINKKDYNVSDSQSNFIIKSDAEEFNKAIELILAYTKAHRIKKTYSMKDFPEKMPDDFTIEYVYNAGDGDRTVYLTKTNCIDQGLLDQKAFNYAWKNTTMPEFETLYSELRKLNAFGLQSEEFANEGDKIDERIKYSVNGKYYAVSNWGNHFITQQDKPSFTESVQLILSYSLKNSRN